MPKRILTREAIIAETLALLQQDGVEGLSMRKLALRLKVQAPTLYYHFPDKSALLNEVLTGLFQGCFGRMPPCASWQEWMRQFGRAVWDAQQDAKFATLLILTTSLDEQHFQSSVAVTRAELARYDADQEQLFYVQSAVQALATGWAVLANAPYAEKIDRMFDLRAGTLESIDALVESWSRRIGADQDA